MRILIIEDEIKTANYLKTGLKNCGYVVDTANDGQEGFFLISEYNYALIILDVMLPKLNGWQLISAIRQLNSSVRVLFLTARDSLNPGCKQPGYSVHLI